jgi:transposase
MRDTEFYRQILGIEVPWTVERVDLNMPEGRVDVYVEHKKSLRWPCPQCQTELAVRDHSEERAWRHLDTCQFRTFLHARIPRVECPDHGVLQVIVPWSLPGSRFTLLFERLIIDWLRDATTKAVAKHLDLDWDAVWGVHRRAVDRGLAKRKLEAPKAIGVDETSFQKRHEYVTTVADLERERVLYVGDGHYTGVLAGFYEQLGPEGLSQLEVICMDMWRSYIGDTRKYVPDADRKIAFDKYHVASLLGKAVDQTRRKEHKVLLAAGDESLKRTRSLWLTNPKNMTAEMVREFKDLKKSTLKTARAWAIKELAMSLWHYQSRAWAEKAWKRWLGWALRCQLPPMRKVAETIQKYLWGIINAIISGATNALSEGMNSRIQALKHRACGYRNRENFRTAIYFHLGGLDLYPALEPTHGKS